MGHRLARRAERAPSPQWWRRGWTFIAPGCLLPFRASKRTVGSSHHRRRHSCCSALLVARVPRRRVCSRGVREVARARRDRHDRTARRRRARYRRAWQPIRPRPRAATMSGSATIQTTLRTGTATRATTKRPGTSATGLRSTVARRVASAVRQTHVQAHQQEQCKCLHEGSCHRRHRRHRTLL